MYRKLKATNKTSLNEPGQGLLVICLKVKYSQNIQDKVSVAHVT